MKSANMISTIGRSPVAAEPTPSPMIAVSVTGVSTTRSLPNSSSRPAVTPKQPPKIPTSSPARNTLGSLRISMRMPSLIASLQLI